uniref:Tryptophan-rich sensory protein n=1 Tax=Pinguiococcus pyrenoidosus TaxID=172671 RepID=A0A7R9YFX9_9STRA
MASVRIFVLLSFFCGAAALRAPLRRLNIQLRPPRLGATPAESALPAPEAPKTDWEQVKKTTAGIAVQMLLINMFCKCVMNPAAHLLTTLSSPVYGTATAAVFFLAMARQSRVFAPMDASRPKGSDEAYQPKWKQPVWAPPGPVFPIVWISIAILRCISATMIWNVTGRNFVSLPLVVYYLHLSIGDAWNNLYTVQKRLGAGAFFIWFVWASVLGLTAVFYKTLPVAGYIIAPSAVWLSIASLLVTRIWELNRKEPQVLIPQSTSESDEAKQ